MALSDKNIVITPNTGQTAEPRIVFSGASSVLGPQNITLNVLPDNNGTLSFEGSAGQLFSITNDLTGTIFSVNDASGIPSFEVDANGTVSIAEFSGNVGIGISAPTQKLHVVGNILASGTVTATSYAGTFNLGTTSINLNRASGAQSLTGISIDGNAGTVTNGVYTTGNQTIGGIKTFSSEVLGRTAAGGTTTVGSFEATTTGGSFASMYTRRGAPFKSNVIHTGSSYAPTVSVQYEYTGLFNGVYSLGHLTTSAANPGNFAIHHIDSAGGNARQWLFDGGNGGFTSPGEVTAFSDISLKDNIEVVADPLTKILSIRGVTFTRKDLDDKETRFMGVIAQEVEQYFPEVVQTTPDGIKTVNYGAMVGALIEAIKEQQKQIDELRAKIK